MNITRLARKKLNQLFLQNRNDVFEIRFRNLVLYDNILKTNGGVLCNKRLVKLIIERATEYRIEILGVETSIDSDLPLHVFVWEDYYEREQSPEWVMDAMKDYLEKNNASLLFFTINIPADRIPELSKITGLTY